MPFDPNSKIDVTLALNSPQIVNFFLSFLKPQDTTWTLFASSLAPDATTDTFHSWTLNNLPTGTKIKYDLHFNGHPNTRYKVDFDGNQAGVNVFSVKIQGSVGSNNSGNEDGIVTL
jgi:hypothetical protein